MPPKSNTERSQEFRKRRKLNKQISMKMHTGRKRERIRKIREKHKIERMLDSGKKEVYAKKEMMRKKEQRKKLKEVTSSKKTNEKLNNKRKRRNREEKEKLQLKVKLFSNENRKLKRKLQQVAADSQTDSDSNDSDSELNISEEILSNVSPSSKNRALRKMKLSGKSPVNKVLRLDRVRVSGSGRKSVLGKKVAEFLYQDLNSLVVPDKKKESKSMRYRLSSLNVLHEKFLAEEDLECSYSQFTRLVAHNVIKPKPEDWGTCLCLTCLNPELKISSLRKVMPDVDITITYATEKSDTELKLIYDKIKASQLMYDYLEWTRSKDDMNAKVKTTTYHALKKACTSNSEEFSIKLKQEIDILKEHTNRMLAQYRRVKQVRQLAQDPAQKAKTIHDGICDFPKKSDKQIIDVKYVFYGPCTGTLSSNQGFVFEEDSEAQRCYQLIKQNNKSCVK